MKAADDGACQTCQSISFMEDHSDFYIESLELFFFVCVSYKTLSELGCKVMIHNVNFRA